LINILFFLFSIFTIIVEPLKWICQSKIHNFILGKAVVRLHERETFISWNVFYMEKQIYHISGVMDNIEDISLNQRLLQVILYLPKGGGLYKIK
jgi:hypothetical protein